MRKQAIKFAIALTAGLAVLCSNVHRRNYFVRDECKTAISQKADLIHWEDSVFRNQDVLSYNDNGELKITLNHLIGIKSFDVFSSEKRYHIELNPDLRTTFLDEVLPLDLEGRVRIVVTISDGERHGVVYDIER